MANAPDLCRSGFSFPGVRRRAKTCLHGAARFPINSAVMFTSNLRRSASVAKMATVKGAWRIAGARPEEGDADTN